MWVRDRKSGPWERTSPSFSLCSLRMARRWRRPGPGECLWDVATGKELHAVKVRGISRVRWPFRPPTASSWPRWMACSCDSGKRHPAKPLVWAAHGTRRWGRLARLHAGWPDAGLRGRRWHRSLVERTTGQQRLRLQNSKIWPLWAWGGGPKAVLSPDGRIVAASCLETPEGEPRWEEMAKGYRCSIRLWDSAAGKPPPGSGERLVNPVGLLAGRQMAPPTVLSLRVAIHRPSLFGRWLPASATNARSAEGVPVFSPQGKPPRYR